MIAKVFTIETDSLDNQYASEILLDGTPKYIARMIAELHGDESVFVNTGDLKNYTVLTAFYHDGEWVVR